MVDDLVYLKQSDVALMDLKQVRVRVRDKVRLGIGSRLVSGSGIRLGSGLDLCVDG